MVDSVICNKPKSSVAALYYSRQGDRSSLPRARGQAILGSKQIADLTLSAMAAPSARALQPELAVAMSSASALERSCTIRSAKGREGVWWADSESYNRCAVDNRLVGHCGEQRPANLTTCLSVEGETYTKEFIVGPFVTTGGNDWTAINYVATLGALEDGMEPADLAIRDYSFTTVRDSPWGAQLGFPPLHNHHTTMHGADAECSTTRRCISTFWLEQQADAQCSGEVDGYACLDHDLRPGGYYYPLRSDAPLTQNCLWNDVRAAGSTPSPRWSTRARPAPTSSTTS